MQANPSRYFLSFAFSICIMFKVNINNRERNIQLNSDLKSGQLDDTSFELDILDSKNGSCHVIWNNKSYNVDIVDLNRVEKKASIRVNGHVVEVDVQDQYDALLKSLGMELGGGQKVKELKSPMPGLVLSIDVKEGDSVAEKDALLILEAMKMENVIKSPAEGVIKKVHVNAGNAVEKNEILLEFE